VTLLSLIFLGALWAKPVLENILPKQAGEKEGPFHYSSLSGALLQTKTQGFGKEE